MVYSRTVKGFGGTFVHQDSNGRILGSSKPNPFNSKEYFHYNTESVLCGRSSPNLGGGYMHYNADRCFIGRSDKNPFGGYVHYDSDAFSVFLIMRIALSISSRIAARPKSSSSLSSFLPSSKLSSLE